MELDSALDFRDLVGEVFVMRDGGWELSGCVDMLAAKSENDQARYHTLGETWTEETRNLLDERIGSDEGIVLASKLLDELLVLVAMHSSVSVSYFLHMRNSQLLQIVSTHGIYAMMLRTIDIVLITQYTDRHARAGYSRKFNSARETLVTLRVVVLQADLQLDGFEEVTLLGVLGVVEQLLHVLTNAGDRDFRHLDGLPEDFLSDLGL